MEINDDDNLELFAADGLRLPEAADSGHVEHAGAKIWYAAFGSGPTVFLLHGGLGHSGNFAKQVPGLVESGYRVVTVDSRGHGRSTRDDQPYSYTLMASDVLAVMDNLRLQRSSAIGWSDGACVALILADLHPDRIDKVFFFACNMDLTGTKEMVESQSLGNCFSRHKTDYASLSATPENFDGFLRDVTTMMETQPNYSAEQLRTIEVPVTVALGEFDEFIKREHVAYLADTLPNAELRILPGVSHFAPIQHPAEFNKELVRFLRSTDRV